jgi:type VI protein secretion system component VasF
MVVPKGGPQGPFYGAINSRGNVIALQIVNEPDAKLIVAAPELLVASKALLAWLQNEEGEETNADLVDRMLRLQVAITKAEKLP